MEQMSNEDKKLWSENMALKKQIKALQLELDELKRFIGGV